MSAWQIIGWTIVVADVGLLALLGLQWWREIRAAQAALEESLRRNDELLADLERAVEKWRMLEEGKKTNG